MAETHLPIRPVRLRLSRQGGFNLQAHSLATNGLAAVSVARPGRYGNPFVVDADQPAGKAVMAFEHECDKASVFQPDQFEKRIAPLRGKNLACWCALDSSPCHADVLLRIANPIACDAVAMSEHERGGNA